MAAVVSKRAWHGAIANIPGQHGRDVLLRFDIIRNRGTTPSQSAKAAATKRRSNWLEIREVPHGDPRIEYRES
jgi:hypothetical protein